MDRVHYSSKSDEWETPWSLFIDLHCEFEFTLDPCATPENAKCEQYFTMEDDGLEKSWEGERVFCNPPYGRKIVKWVKKASEQDGLVVMLLPARTDTVWFHKYIYEKAEIRFLKGRLKFGDSVNSAPFPSMVVIFNG